MKNAIIVLQAASTLLICANLAAGKVWIAALALACSVAALVLIIIKGGHKVGQNVKCC